jgi:hypothetical protein
MSMQPTEQQAPPRGHIRVVYLGPVAPHWRVDSDFGDRATIEQFRQRASCSCLPTTRSSGAPGSGSCVTPSGRIFCWTGTSGSPRTTAAPDRGHG